jgi:hypothetical protein
MAQIVRDASRLQSWVKEKQANEQRMLFRLNSLFNSPMPRNKIRMVVRAAFERMWAEARDDTMWPRVLGALTAEQNLAVWVKAATGDPRLRVQRTLEKLRLGTAAQPQLDCNDFSELIRVIGTWLEQGGGFGSPNINKAYRSGVDSIPASAPHGAGLAIAQQDALNRKQWGADLRQREDPSGEPDRSFHHAIEDHVSQWWVRPRAGRESGMQMFRANRNDLCKRTDLLFGLLVGATLSGTTTDTVFVLESFGAAPPVGLHPGYYLFPVATIAATLHHTLVEAGFALTLADVIDSYCVGFYTSLKPRAGFPPELQEAEAVLQEAEKDPGNRRFILWYDGNETAPAGGILFEKPFEIDAFRRLAEGKGLMTHAMSMPAVPNQRDVARFIDLMAPKLIPLLPQEFQPRRYR